MDTRDSCYEVGEKLETLKRVVLQHWENRVRAVIATSRNESSIILVDHMPQIIDQLVSLFKKGEIDEIELGKAHGFYRALITNYSLPDLLTEFSLLRESLIDYLYPMGDVQCAKIVHKYVDILSKHSVVEFTNSLLMRDQLERKHVPSEVEEIKKNPVISENHIRSFHSDL